MKKCLKISANCKNAEKAKREFIQKIAQEAGIEGIVQHEENKIVIYVCGLLDRVDDFVDLLYVGSKAYMFLDIEIESCENRDYRGVFRVVE